jgi:hypothetical protein
MSSMRAKPTWEYVPAISIRQSGRRRTFAYLALGGKRIGAMGLAGSATDGGEG